MEPIFTETQKGELRAMYAVAMHLTANEKVGRIARYITIASVIAAIWARTGWPLLVGFVLDLSVYRYMISSCVRFVESKTGMPAEIQTQCSRLYKTDAAFAARVDAFKRGEVRLEADESP